MPDLLETRSSQNGATLPTDSECSLVKPSSIPTIRSLVLGVVGVALLCAVTPYSDDRLKQTYIYGNHFPLGCLFLFTLLTLVGNPMLKRISPRYALNRVDLLTVWVMLISGSGLASSGLMRYLGPLPVAPFYFSSASNNWADWMRHIPAWMVPSRDPSSKAVKWFFEGVPLGESIPWQPWVHVFAAWGGLFACVVGLSVCVCALVNRQWIEQEKLSFPLTQIPLEMSREPQGGVMNPFYQSRLLWIGIGVATLIHGVNGLHSYWPLMPAITMRWDIGTATEQMPWSALGFGSFELFLSVIGVMFILPTEVSFSLWAFFVAFRLIRFERVVTGMEALSVTPPNHEVAMGIGGFLLWGVWMLWKSRQQVLEAWRRKDASGDEKRERLSIRRASLGAVVSFVVAVCWTIASGAAPWLAIAVWALFVVIMIVCTRVVAESGLLFVQAPFIPTDLIAVVPGSQFFNAQGLGSITMVQTIFIQDTREALMPTIMNSFKIKHQQTMAGMLKAILLAISVGYVVSFVSFLHTSYTYGGLSLDSWGNLNAPNIYYNRIAGYLGAPKGANPAAIAKILFGAGMTAGLLFMRSNFLWWSLHPIGFILAGTYAISRIWFSIFVAWLIKRMIVRWGGLRMFRAALPFFFGLVIGEALVAGFWIIVGMITGISTPNFMPN
ncbi:MAG: DUF6785 family protein [Armatimonadota bacterium]